MNVRAWLRERTGARPCEPATVPGGPSFAYVFGWVLLLVLLVEAVTGIALAAFYSPSTNNAWGSVAYIQDQAALGWLVRGLHFHGASALVIIAGIHLVQTAVSGAYKAPRELTWWIGIVLMALVLAFAITGYVLRWDQAAYSANKVEIGIAAATPLVGEHVRALLLGGNAYGNLTLTRFYMLHVIVLPGLFGVLTAAHLMLARRHGSTPRASLSPEQLVAATTPRWPQQSVRNAIAMAVAMAALLAFVIAQHGADLSAPADPSSAYDPRPLWYFRWLFELRHLAGSAEKVVALLAPAVVGGFLVALPLADRNPDRNLWRRWPWVAGVVGMFAVIGALTIASFAGDAGDTELTKREAASEVVAQRARALAVANGVPVTGGPDVFKTVPMWRARTLFASRCAGCHVGDATHTYDAEHEDQRDRKGPLITAGHGDRAWLRGFLAAPSADIYWGRTKLAKLDAAMKPVTLEHPADLDDLVEMLYAETGASDVDAAKRTRGLALFDKACTDCHSRDEDTAGQSAPSLAGLGSRAGYQAFIANPGSPLHMKDDHQMPRFDHELSIVDRDLIAEYLVWLRTATPSDVAALGPL